MPRCRKSYRGSRSKAQVPGLSSFPLLIRSSPLVRFVPFRPSVRSIDRGISFFRPACTRVAYVFSPSSGLVPSLDVSTYICLPPPLPGRAVVVVADAAASVNRPCANVSRFKPFISGKKFRERSNAAAIANRDVRIHADTHEE